MALRRAVQRSASILAKAIANTKATAQISVAARAATRVSVPQVRSASTLSFKASVIAPTVFTTTLQPTTTMKFSFFKPTQPTIRFFSQEAEEQQQEYAVEQHQEQQQQQRGRYRQPLTEEEKAERNSRTVFVGNLDTKISEGELREALAHTGNIVAIRLLWNDKYFGVHKGVAFVEYGTVEEARNFAAQTDVQIRGRPIRVNMAGERPQRTPVAPEYTAYLGNLPFDATEDDIRTALAHCGEVTKVNIIKYKDTGKPRGYGYVSFANPEAKQAALAATGFELGGRQIRVQEVLHRRQEEQQQPRRRYNNDNMMNGNRQGRPQRQRQPEQQQHDEY